MYLNMFLMPEEYSTVELLTMTVAVFDVFVAFVIL